MMTEAEAYKKLTEDILQELEEKNDVEALAYIYAMTVFYLQRSGREND